MQGSSSQSGDLPVMPEVQIGGLKSAVAGLYQINVMVPAGATDGDNDVTAVYQASTRHLAQCS